MATDTLPTRTSTKKPAVAPRAKPASRKSPAKSTGTAATNAAPKAAGKRPTKTAAKKLASPVKTKATAPAKPTQVAASMIKNKLIRDSFTIPKTEYAVLTALKDRALSLTRQVKKSELLRAGISALDTMHDKEFLATLNTVPSLKTGRPKNDTEADKSKTPRKP